MGAPRTRPWMQAWGELPVVKGVPDLWLDDGVADLVPYGNHLCMILAARR